MTQKQIAQSGATLVWLLSMAGLCSFAKTARGPQAHSPAKMEAKPSAAALSPDKRRDAQSLLARSPLVFERNVGQFSPDVRYLSRGDGCEVALTDSEAILKLSSPPAKGKNEKPAPDAFLRMDLVGARRSAPVAGEKAALTKVNYLVGKDPKEWHTNVQTFDKVRYASVYPGVDAVYYGNHRQLEYDFQVAPHASTQPIRVRFRGADSAQLNERGDLVLRVAGKSVVQHAPIAYQIVDGKRETVAARYVVLARPKNGNATTQVGFALGQYNHNLPLVIDPTIAYATLFYEEVADIVADGAGNVYIAGNATPDDYAGEALPGGAKPTFLNGQPADFEQVYVAKINASCSAVSFMTFYGGRQNTGGTYVHGGGFGSQNSLALDSGGNVYVAANTSDPDLPVPNGLQTTLKKNSSPSGTSLDTVLFKLDPTGAKLLYASYLGGSNVADAAGGNQNISSESTVIGIATDASGNAYVAGETNTSDFPRTHTYNSSGFGTFITKINTNASGVNSLLSSTIFPGGDTKGFTIDKAGNSYIVGIINIGSDSVNDDGTIRPDVFPILNPLPGTRIKVDPKSPPNPDSQSFYGGGFLAKFSPTGGLLFSTLDIGGLYGRLAHDNANGLYVVWQPFSYEKGPASNGPIKAERAAKINDDDSGVVYVTDFGGPGDATIGSAFSQEDPTDVAVDSLGRLYVTGYTDSSTFPQIDPLPAPFSPTAMETNIAAFLMQLSTDGKSLVFSTKYTGSTGSGVAVDPSDNVYVAGSSIYTKTPAQNGLPIQYGGGFVLKLGTAVNKAVNSIADRDDINPGDGACYTGQKTSSGAPECTLRASIEEANTSKDAEPYPITFNIPGAAIPSIAPLKPLPIISHPVKMDGTTQPGGMLVELNGASAGTASGLTINAGGSTIQGMVINRFKTDGILLLNKGGDTIQNCFIGVDAAGKIARGNGQSGIHAQKSPNNLIGGTVASARNIISGTRVAATNGDNGVGVWIDAGSTNTQVQGNFIGTDKTGGKALPNGIGVQVGSDALAKSPPALNALIGGVATKPGTAPGNVISGNSNIGVAIAYSSRSTVTGNLIGTSVGGTTGVPNGYAGIRVFRASSNTIGGTLVGAANVVSGNSKDGIQIFGAGASGNTVTGNFVGTTLSGTAALGNGLVGVHLLGSSNNIVGGTSVAARNIISGNAKGYGVWIQASNTAQTSGGKATDGATSNLVMGNFIGLNVSGSAALANGSGVVIDGDDGSGKALSVFASKNAVTGNTVSGNASVGVGICGAAQSNTIQNNFIGTNPTGSSPLGNGFYGVVVQQSLQNTIANNTVSGNSHAGVVFAGTYPSGTAPTFFPAASATGLGVSDNVLKSNFIGTTPGGLRALPNGARASKGAGAGVLILPGGGDDNGGNQIGVPGAGNVISGNTGAGIAFLGGSNNAVQSNLIGVSGNGSAAIPNTGAGVSMMCNSNNIGGLAASQGNLIAYNTGAGVAVVGGWDNAILSNAIFANKRLGIDLGGDGRVNPLLPSNKQGTSVGGANHSQNYPQIASIQHSGSTTVISATLQSAPKTSYVVQFFANVLRDASGYGQGQRFLGNVTVSTDADGLAKLAFKYGGTLAANEAVSMTATGAKDDLSTSEFSSLPLAISGGVYHFVTDPNNPKATMKQGVSGVLLQRLEDGFVAAQENTGIDGLYNFNAAPRGQFTIVPVLQGLGFGFEFDPRLRVVTLPSSSASHDATGVDFVFYSLGGTVVNSVGKPVSGATVTLTGTTPDTDGTLTRTLKTNTQGQFLFDGLTRGTYKVAASGDVASVASLTLPSTGLSGISPNGQINLAPAAPPTRANALQTGSGGNS